MYTFNIVPYCIVFSCYDNTQLNLCLGAPVHVEPVVRFDEEGDRKVSE